MIAGGSGAFMGLIVSLFPIPAAVETVLWLLILAGWAAYLWFSRCLDAWLPPLLMGLVSGIATAALKILFLPLYTRHHEEFDGVKPFSAMLAILIVNILLGVLVGAFLGASFWLADKVRRESYSN